MRLLLIVLFFVPLHVFANDGYVESLQQKVNAAGTFTEKLLAYENWLPIAIMLHHPMVKKSLSEFNDLVKKENSELALGVYDLNMAYFIAENLGDYNKGLELCLKAKSIFEKLNAKKEMVMVYNQITFIILWNQIGKKEIVNKENLYEKYLSRSLQLSDELKDRNLQVYTLNVIASYYIVTEKNYDKSLEYFHKCERRLSTDITPYNRLGIFGGLAIVYAEIKDEPAMLFYLNKLEADPYFESYGYGRSNVYRSIAKYYLANSNDKNYEKALYYAEKSYAISLKMNAPEYISQGSQLLYEINKQLGNSKKALFFHEKFKNTEDSLARERFQKTYAAYDVIKKEATIKTLENEKLKQVNDRSNLIRFSLIAALAMGIFFGAYIFWSNKKLKKQNVQLLNKNKEIEQALIKGQNIERKRVAADLHDNLGVQANAILYNTELLKNEKNSNEPLVEQLHNTAKEMLLNLRDTLWAMKTEEIAAADLWLRIIGFSKQMGRSYPAIVFATEGNAHATLKISASRALNTVMILQEAIQNAVKHAGATVINTSSVTDNKNWIITVSDNGKGFNNEKTIVKSDSFGLLNMNERATASALSLKISSDEDKGTQVVLNITT